MQELNSDQLNYCGTTFRFRSKLALVRGEVEDTSHPRSQGISPFRQRETLGTRLDTPLPDKKAVLFSE